MTRRNWRETVRRSRIIGALVFGSGVVIAGETVDSFVRASSSYGLVSDGDGRLVLGRPDRRSSVKLEARDGWRFADGSTETEIEHLPGKKESVRLEGKDDEETVDLEIADDWPEEHSCKPPQVMTKHIETAKLYGAEDGHALCLYRANEEGIETLPLCATGPGETVDGLHKKTTKYNACEVPECPDNEREETEDVPIVVEEKDIVKEKEELPEATNGRYPVGEYEVVSKWTWTKADCEEEKCKAEITAKSLISVCSLDLQAEDWIGIDKTEEGRGKKEHYKAKAVIEGKCDEEAQCTWSLSDRLKEVEESGKDQTSGKELTYSLVEEPKPSESYLGDWVEVSATITSGSECSATETMRTNCTVVVVDVTIAMPGCTTVEKSEELEEKQGAFIRFEEDYGGSTFTVRAEESLVPVSITCTPSDLPSSVPVSIEFPEEELWEVGGSEKKPTYKLAKKSYTASELAEKKFVLHGHKRSMELRDREIVVRHEESGAIDCAKYTVVELDLVPDYQRDHVIDSEDERMAAAKKVFHWWINDDGDGGDCADCYADNGTEIPGGDGWEPNCDDDKVNGRTDLLDFFPLWTKIGQAYKLIEKDDDLRLRFYTSGLGYALTKLDTDSAGIFLKQDSDAASEGFFSLNRRLHEAKIRKNNQGDSDYGLTKDYLKQIEGNMSKHGIVMMEGVSAGGKATLELVLKGEPVLSVEFACEMHNVEDLYAKLSLAGRTASYTPRRLKDPGFANGATQVFFLHGFKVSENNARGWHSDAFKRLHQSGSDAPFIGVTWPGRKQNVWFPGLYYHDCAVSAIDSGRRLAEFLAKDHPDLKGSRLFMAHSLGNMVVSAAIQDWNMSANQYFMLNAAVPSEAYDANCYRPDAGITRYLVHAVWRQTKEWQSGYPLSTYCSEWHHLFENDVDPVAATRAKLTWQRRFGDVASRTTVINYNSPEDEVFEISPDEDFGQITGWIPNGTMFDRKKSFWEYLYKWLLIDNSRYCWQKQELGKGVVHGNVMANSGYAGWGFNPKKVGEETFWTAADEHRYSNSLWLWENRNKEELYAILRTDPVFRPSPQSVFGDNSTAVDKEVCDNLLCCAIPAVSEAMGRVGGSIGGITTKEMTSLRAGWGRKSLVYGARWLHCDLKDMAYFYNYPLWEDFVDQGGLGGK